MEYFSDRDQKKNALAISSNQSKPVSSYDQVHENYKKSLPLLKKVDIVFNALHGTLGEDGTIQKWLEANNIKYTGSNSVSSALCMDKIKCKKILNENDFLTPDWVEYEKGIEISDIS